MPDEENNTIEWTALEFDYYSKSKSWFVGFGIVAVLLALWGIWTKNIIFVILIGLSYFTLVVFAFKKPRGVQFAITPKGVNVDENLYNYDDLKSFWIFYEPPEVTEISLHSKKIATPYIKIPLGDQNPVEIRRMLIKYIPEIKQETSLADNLSRTIKF